MVTVYTSQGVTIRNTVVQYSVPVVLKRSALTVVWKQTWLVTAEEAEPELKELKYFLKINWPPMGVCKNKNFNKI